MKSTFKRHDCHWAQLWPARQSTGPALQSLGPARKSLGQARQTLSPARYSLSSGIAVLNPANQSTSSGQAVFVPAWQFPSSDQEFLDPAGQSPSSGQAVLTWLQAIPSSGQVVLVTARQSSAQAWPSERPGSLGSNKAFHELFLAFIRRGRPFFELANQSLDLPRSSQTFPGGPSQPVSGLNKAVPETSQPVPEPCYSVP
jgi:hypothetical protein